MIVTIERGADASAVRRALIERGLWVEPHGAGDAIRFVVAPCSARVEAAALLAIDGVCEVDSPASPHPRVDAQPAVVDVAGVRVGVGAPPVFIAGPCSLESAEQVRAIAERVAPLGARILRGGAFKPRTSPYSFQGHGERALRWMRDAADATGMRVVTEAMSPEQVELVAGYADMLQIGSRNMQSFPLLERAGDARLPILLKRGMSATVEEWLSAAEYCLLAGAPAVVFCERGIRGFDPSTRNVLDLGAVALLSGVMGLPVVVDPSHGAGRRDLIAALSRAAIAAGAAGLMLETHDSPGHALSDGPQALLPDQLRDVLTELGGGR